MGYGPGCKYCQEPSKEMAAPMGAAGVETASAVAAPTTTPTAAEAPATPTVPVDAPPTAKLYFDVGKTALPADTDTTIAEVVAYLKAHEGAKALVSGFHDPTGDAAANAELAKGRALAVIAKLTSLGIAVDRVVGEKPQSTTGTGTLSEARRVEVSVTN